MVTVRAICWTGRHRGADDWPHSECEGVQSMFLLAPSQAAYPYVYWPVGSSHRALEVSSPRRPLLRGRAKYCITPKIVLR